MAIDSALTTHVGPFSYLVRGRIERPFRAALFQDMRERDSIIPAVVLDVPDSKVSVNALQESLAQFALNDDVFTEHFIQNGLLVVQTGQPPDPTPTLSDDLRGYLEERSTKLVFLGPDNDRGSLPEGPYFVSHRGFHQAWMLYEDNLEAFVVTVVPNDDNPSVYNPVRLTGQTGLYRSIAVPSRLYFTKSPEKPLNGVRVAIKDNMHLNGIVTTLGSRSFTACYGVQTATSKFVEHLIAQGAVIVGKTKLSAYAGAEIPPEKCIDYFPPWNARADGYQGPSGSSSGTGASIGGYGWLDLSFGTDTTGSIRMPAAAHGVWGLRVSGNILPLEGIVPSAPPLDTIGMLSRDADGIRGALLSYSFKESSKLPTKILYPIDWFPYPNPVQQQMTEEFIKILEQLLGIQHQKVSLKEEWTRSAPEHLRQTPITDYLRNTVERINLYDGYHSFDKFREDHHKLFGHKPYVSPYHTKRWDMGKEFTKEERAESDEETKTYKNWIEQHILTKDEDGDSDAIMVLPLGRPGPNYRDIVPPPPPSTPAWYSGYDEDFFASLLELPQLVIPIGQNPFESKVTQRTEYFPIVGSIASAKGSDLLLIEVALQALSKAGWPTKVQAGRQPFAVGDNLRHVSDPID